jgi:hypothetical protein
MVLQHEQWDAAFDFAGRVTYADSYRLALVGVISMSDNLLQRVAIAIFSPQLDWRFPREREVEAVELITYALPCFSLQ